MYGGYCLKHVKIKLVKLRGLPGGSVVKNLPSIAGDVGLSPVRELHATGQLVYMPQLEKALVWQ